MKIRKWGVFALQTPLYLLAAVLVGLGFVGLYLCHLGIKIQDRVCPDDDDAVWENIVDEILGVSRVTS